MLLMLLFCGEKKLNIRFNQINQFTPTDLQGATAIKPAWKPVNYDIQELHQQLIKLFYWI